MHNSMLKFHPKPDDEMAGDPPSTLFYLSEYFLPMRKQIMYSNMTRRDDEILN